MMAAKNWSYDEVTRSMEATLRTLSDEAAGQLDEDAQSHWDLAHGVLRAWSDLVGPAARAQDRERLETIINHMAHAVSGSDSGSWRVSEVVELDDTTAARIEGYLGNRLPP